MNINELLKNVKDAYSNVEKPTKMVNEEKNCEECVSIQESLINKKRETITNEEIIEIFGHLNINLMSPDAIQYFMPNIIKTALEDRDGDFLIDVIYFFYDISKFRELQLSRLNSFQKTIVFEFLKFVAVEKENIIKNFGYEEEVRKAIDIWQIKSERPFA